MASRLTEHLLLQFFGETPHRSCNLCSVSCGSRNSIMMRWVTMAFRVVIALFGISLLPFAAAADWAAPRICMLLHLRRAFIWWVAAMLVIISYAATLSMLWKTWPWYGRVRACNACVLEGNASHVLSVYIHIESLSVLTCLHAVALSTYAMLTSILALWIACASHLLWIPWPYWTAAVCTCGFIFRF